MSIVMRKIIILSLFVVVAATVKSQDNLSYKPLSSFKNDTIAYFVYNFENRADFYKGKTIDEVLRDFRLPVVFYRVNFILRPLGYRSLHLFVNSDTDFTSESSFYIYIVGSTDYSEYAPVIGEWSENIYESLKAIKVESVGVSVPRNSESYKERERKWKKEKEKETPRFIPEHAPVFHRWDPDKHLE